jgi:cation:H+ antiporter
VTYVLFAVGLVLLILGSELLVRGASRLAAFTGVTPLVIGLTVVAFGTSAPEMAVSVVSARSGAAGADVAIGNVVGSNIFNVLFILGVSALIAPLAVATKLVRIDVPVMIGLSCLLLLLALDGTVSFLEGVLLFGGIIAYTLFAVLQGRKEATAAAAANASESGGAERGSVLVQVLLIAAGLAMLVLGSRWLVDGAITIAQTLGVSELVISLTIVAAGTSLPEVATSVLASIRGQRDIAVGNVVGSNIFNLLAVLGLSAMAAPGGLEVSDAAIGFDIPVMIAAAVVTLPIFFTGYRIRRLEGLLFLAYYAAYTLYLVLAASGHDALPLFGRVMVYFTVPATALILLVAVFRQLRRR